MEIVAAKLERYFRPIERRDLVPESDWEFGYFGRHWVFALVDDVVPRDVYRELTYRKFNRRVDARGTVGCGSTSGKAGGWWGEAGNVAAEGRGERVRIGVAVEPMGEWVGGAEARMRSPVGGGSSAQSSKSSGSDWSNRKSGTGSGSTGSKLDVWSSMKSRWGGPRAGARGGGLLGRSR